MKRFKQHITKRARATAKRVAKLRQKERDRAAKLIDDLTSILPAYINLHYGDPVTGREAAILDGPTLVRLSAATTLHSLLLANKPKGRKR